MSLFKTLAELTLEPLFGDLVYRLSGVSSAYVLKSDMACSFPVDAVRGQEDWVRRNERP